VKLDPGLCSKGFPSKIDIKLFQTIMHKNVRWHNALTNRLTIQDFPTFKKQIQVLYNEVIKIDGGNLATYPRQLGQLNPDKFAVTFCSVDGQQFSFGDADVPITVMDCIKSFIYCLALEEHGAELVHKYVGCEPSGRKFNERVLNSEGKPHNPLVASGSMIVGSMIKANLPIADRWDYVSTIWQHMCGTKNQMGINNSLFLTMQSSAYREWCLAYMMKEEEGWPNRKNGFPVDCNVQEALDFYLMNLSLEATAQEIAVAAATIANSGICPLTEKVIFHPNSTKGLLSMMFSNGLYTSSGEFAFHMGFPASSSSSGIIMIVIPGLGGFCVWSPRLNSVGISIRGLHYCKSLSNTFKFHNFDPLLTSKGKNDPKMRSKTGQSAKVLLLYGAHMGNLDLVRRILARGIKINGGDYDNRTALHLAACGGHRDVVEYLLNRGADRYRKDRFGNTPIDDAKREGHKELLELFEIHSSPPTSSNTPELMIFGDVHGKGIIHKKDILHELGLMGLLPDDPRIVEIFQNVPDSFGPDIAKNNFCK